MRNFPFQIVVAMTDERVIGHANKIPWHFSEDLKLLKRITMGNTVVMGRNTFESIGKPLPGRLNIVISRTMSPRDGLIIVDSLEEAIKRGEETGKALFCLGGASIYRQVLPLTGKMFISIVHGHYSGDIYFPEYAHDEWRAVREEPHSGFTLVEYERKFAGS